MRQLTRKTKFIITGAFALLSLGSLIFILSSANKSRPTGPSGGVLPTPQIPNYLSQKLEVGFTVKETAFNFPASLPLLTKQNSAPLSRPQALAIARSLGMIADPIENQDVLNGTVMVWNNPNNFLIITPQINRIKYGPSHNPNTVIPNILNKQLSDNDLQTLATDFLKNKIGVAESSLKFAGFQYFIPQPGQELFKVTTKNQARIIQLNYSQVATDYPVLTLDPNSTLIYVQFLLDGTILNSEINLTGQFTPGVTQYNLLTFKDLSSKINASILVSLNDGSVNLPDVSKGGVSNLSVNDISLGYLFDTAQSATLQPIFILKGTAQVVGYSTPVSAVLYLPALTSP
jgi:hypothetical protein